MVKKSSIWRRSIWRTEVEVRVQELRHRLAAAEHVDSAKWSADQSEESRRAAKAVVKGCLDRAGEAAAKTQTFWGELDSWWTGDTMTTAWEAVHEAELKLVRLEDSEAVRASLPRLLAWIQRAMESGESRSSYEKALKDQAGDDKAIDLTLIEQAFKDVIVANNDRYSNLRTFRNTLILVTALLAGLIGVLAAWHALNPGFVTLCSAESENGVRHCLDGSDPHRSDVALVALIGAVGGLLAIAFGLAETETPPSRYDPRAWQALLKPVAGAATALAGVLLIQADLLIGPASSRSESLFLSYAVIFGFSQQLFTRFVDKRAGTLIGTGEEKPEDPSKKK
jgi:hypothetical protein